MPEDTHARAPVAPARGASGPGFIAAAWASDLPERYLVPAIIATLPLEFTKLYFPSQVIEVSRLLMVLGLAILAVRVAAGRTALRIPRRRSLLAISVLLALALGTALIYHSGSGLKSAGASIIYLAVAILAYNWTSTLDSQRRAWLTLLATGIVIGLVGTSLRWLGLSIWNPDLSSGYHRANSTFGDPNIYARFLTFVVAGSLVLGWEFARRRDRWIAVLAGLVAAFSLPYTFSRFGWVVTALAGLVALALTRTRRNAALLAAGMLVVFGLAILQDRAVASRSALLARNLASPVTSPGKPTALDARTPPGVSRILNLIPLDSERRYLIVAGLAMYWDHPVLGVGYGNFQLHIETDYAAYKPAAYQTTLEHTTVVKIAAELGTVGLLLLLWFFVELAIDFRHGFSRAGPVSPLLAATLVGFLTILVSSQVAGRLLDEPYLWLFLGLLYGALEAGRAEAPATAGLPGQAAARRLQVR